MRAKKFIEDNIEHAKAAETITGIPFVVNLVHGAFESDWGNKSIGNNIFGVKYREGDWGKQEVLTTEYYQNKKDFDRNKRVVTYNFDSDSHKFKVMVRADFADYKTPRDAFIEHSKLLLTKRYLPCLKYKNDIKRYLICIWKAGYATDPNYDKKIVGVVDSVLKRLN